jgi:hypothetical protein
LSDSDRVEPRRPGQRASRARTRRIDRRDQAARHVALRIARLLGGQRHSLDGEEEPDRERECGPDALDAERQEVRSSRRVGRRDVGQLRESNSGSIAITNTISATTAIAVIANISLSASPTPIRWMPTKTA